MARADHGKADLLFLQVTSFLGGAERSGVELATALQALGFTVMFTIDPAGPAFRMANDSLSRVIPIPFAPLVKPRLADLLSGDAVCKLTEAAGAIRRIRALSKSVSIAYANGDHALVYAALSGMKCPFIYHARDVRLIGHALSLAVEKAEHVVASSRFVAKHLAGNGVPEEKISVVHNGIDIDYYSKVPEKTAARKMLRLPEDAPLALWLGNVVGWKRPLTFIHAAQKLAGKVLFVLVGGTHYPTDEPFLGEVRAEAERAGVKMLPFSDDPRPFYAAADVFVSTSVREPFGRALVEAMAAGCPVVSTDEGGKTEIIEDGVDGLLISADDVGALAGAIERLLADDQLRTKITCNAKAKALERFSMKRCAAEVAQVIKQVMAQHGKKG
jgi:glycosyltransferase involved in cell wall biosynthesis